MDNLITNNYKLYTRILGTHNTKTIVFLPGFTGSSTMWDSNFEALSQNYRLIFLDILGFGHSPKPDISYTVEEHLHSIRYTIQSLGLEKYYLVGYSMGCLMVLAYAKEFGDEVSKLILLALPAYFDEEDARQTVKRSSLFNRLIAMDNPLAHVACSIMCRFRPLFMLVVPWFVRNVPRIVAKDALRHTWQSYSKTLQNVIFKAHTRQWLIVVGASLPILIIQGTKDNIAPMEKVQTMIKGIPKVTLTSIAADHYLVFENSRFIVKEIETFLQKPL